MAEQGDLNRRALIGASGLAVAAAAAGPALAQKATSLAGKTILITGASSGFGRLAALHFADLGATVVASMRNLQGGKRPEAASLLAEAKGKPGKVHVVEIDVTKPDQVTSGVAAADKIAGGALDAVVSNAGIAIGGPLELHDDAALALQIETNLVGGLRVARAALPAMRAKKAGVILPVSSQLGRLVLPNVGGYCATKFGLEAAFEAMAYELAPFGVEICIIEPGGYPTRIWDNGATLTNAAMARADAGARAAYAQHVAMTGGFMQGVRDTDPMDVPRAMAEVIALPQGSRPLRRPVHPNAQATLAANAALGQIQDRAMAQGPFAPWRKAVAD